MRLTTLRLSDTVTGAPTTASVVNPDGTVSPLGGYPDVAAFLAAPADTRAGVVEAAQGTALPAPRPGAYAPVVPRPAKIFCIGLNYRSHIEETGEKIPEYPTVFTKFARSLTGPYDSIEVPVEDHRLDYEGELTVVIGSGGRRLKGDAAAAAIGGYTIGNDVSMRGWQGRTSEWTQGKAWEASTPVGPWVLTPDEFEEGARLTTSVNGEVVQDAPTSDLVFSPVDLVEYLSAMITLEPGDLIMTGTTAGVALGRRNEQGRHPWLKSGDVVEVAIEGLGSQRTEVA
jgi:acylpyruvate hydrolase